MEPVTLGYRAVAALARALPVPVADALVRTASGPAMAMTPSRALLAARNAERAARRTLSDVERRRAARWAFEAYGRYWLESFRLPKLTREAIDDGMTFQGYEHLARAVASGTGPIVALPHLGGWEWLAFWVTQIERQPLTAVVERLEPDELFDFFVEFRQELGMNIVPLSPRAGTEVVAALRRGEIVCLLCDRDIDGAGVEVTFFGERTTLPAGPATLALRTGAPLVPMVGYFDGARHHCVVQEPVEVRREGRLRDDVRRITQALAHRLEQLIEGAPDQWHLMQPNWPSDHELLAANGFTSS